MAYAIKDLADKLKERGLDLAEDAVKIIVDETALWADAEANKGEHGFVDVAVKALIPLAKPLLDEQVDKIDGKEG